MQSYTANKRNGILKYIVNIWAMRIYWMLGNILKKQPANKQRHESIFRENHICQQSTF